VLIVIRHGAVSLVAYPVAADASATRNPPHRAVQAALQMLTLRQPKIFAIAQDRDRMLSDGAGRPSTSA